MISSYSASRSAATRSSHAGEPLVQLGARLLGECLVGRVADQQMPEPIRLVAGEGGLVGSDQLHPHEAGQPVPNLRRASAQEPSR